MSSHFIDVILSTEDIDIFKEVTVELVTHKPDPIEGIGTPPDEVSVGRVYCVDRLTGEEEEEAAEIAMNEYQKGNYE
jgi:hypothetical protein